MIHFLQIHANTIVTMLQLHKTRQTFHKFLRSLNKYKHFLATIPLSLVKIPFLLHDFPVFCGLLSRNLHDLPKFIIVIHLVIIETSMESMENIQAYAATAQGSHLIHSTEVPALQLLSPWRVETAPGSSPRWRSPWLPRGRSHGGQ